MEIKRGDEDRGHHLIFMVARRCRTLCSSSWGKCGGLVIVHHRAKHPEATAIGSVWEIETFSGALPGTWTTVLLQRCASRIREETHALAGREVDICGKLWTPVRQRGFACDNT